MERTTKIFLLLAAFGLLVWLAACDKIGKDTEPKPDKTSKYTAKINEPVVINLLKKHNLTAQATFQLKGSPKYGTAKFVENGLLLYAPTTNVTAMDSVQYQLCTNGNCEDFAIRVEIIAQNDIDSINACSQGAFSDIDTLYLPNQSLVIDVLANDFFCNNNAPDATTLTVISQPLRGTATVVPSNASPNNRVIQYTFNPNAPSTNNPDILIYSVAEEGNPSNVKYAAVVIYIKKEHENDCTLNLQDDNVTVQHATSVNIPVLDNDSFCHDSLVPDILEAFQIIQQPTHGSVSSMLHESGFYYHVVGYTGQDSFIYQVKYQNGKTDQATVNITTPAICVGTPPNLNDDSFTFSHSVVSDSLSDGSVKFYVINNDTFCPTYYNYEALTISQQPPVGQGTVTDNFGSFTYHLPNNTFTGTVVFQYKYCDTNNICDTATVTLNITN